MARKAELMSRQHQLAERGAPVTILNVITASNGNERTHMCTEMILT